MKLNQTICTVFITLLVLSVASTAHAGKGNGKNKGGGGSGDGDTGGLTPVTITFRDDPADPRIAALGFARRRLGGRQIVAARQLGAGLRKGRGGVDQQVRRAIVYARLPP